MQFDKEIPVAFADGDTFSIQIRANGKFAIHQNGKLLARREMDRGCPLTAESTGNTNFYLYGLGAIGEKTTD
ncbi:MAG: hypothetical protein L6Q26_05495 [Anaerolineales bacterium]|nr:hypothetical protein [Anaerolineales bacterium]NUQ84993.1 hypothetical protein [Anaerolineales bacterium]